uniref:Uncharacterized protein n=1 Tax=Setaria viridis TaxID=4556 RepID=A0A4U6ULX9_SETVI|nr:hypothetical protein SEVIR_5G364180v2 [Setaria viridis]
MTTIPSPAQYAQHRPSSFNRPSQHLDNLPRYLLDLSPPLAIVSAAGNGRFPARHCRAKTDLHPHADDHPPVTIFAG